MTLDQWNALPAAAASEALARCCGSSAWVERMVARRPFSLAAYVIEVGRAVWMALEPSDWREAFAQHPRIGDLEALRLRFGPAAELAAGEQGRVPTASRVVLEALAEGNRAYEERFGYIFIVFASGRTAEEMLALLRDRLGNDPERELAIAAEEQWKITRLRLDRMLDGPH